MKDHMMALHQRFCKEPECREVRKELRVASWDAKEAAGRVRPV